LNGQVVWSVSDAMCSILIFLRVAQQDPLAAGAKECSQEEVAISGLLDGTGEYTLVYEDYEGDRVLVGDVPWG
jgi:auxin-responsive protein IAA